MADVRTAARAFPRDHGCVSTVITSPPYLDVTAYEEDQWLRLWFLGGPPRPTWGLHSQDDRHRSDDNYWKFLEESWAGISPLLRSRATIVCRVGSRRFSVADLEAKLRTSLRCVWPKVRLVDGPTTSRLRGSRATLLDAEAKGCRFEMDVAYSVRSA